MGDEAKIRETFPFDDVDDIGDMGVEIDILTQQMRAFTKPGERRREYFVAFYLKLVRQWRQHQPPQKDPERRTNVLWADCARAGRMRPSD